MSKKVLFSENSQVVCKNTYEGGKAYYLSLNEQLCNVFTLSLLNGSFYVSQEQMVKDAKDLFTVAMQTCPETATKYALYAAEVLGMKLMPVVWLAYVSTLEDKTLFKKAFPRIIGTNVKLMHDFVDICRNSDIRPGGSNFQKVKKSNKGLGQCIKKTINKHAYDIINDYNATRFTGKWEDICKLTHPVDKVVHRKVDGELKNVDTKKYWQYICKPKDSGRRLTFDRAIKLQETIDILSNKNMKISEFVKALQNIKDYKLQMDEIKFTFGNLDKDTLKLVYEYFVPGMTYAAMILNLVAIERAFATHTHIEMKEDPNDYTKRYKQVVVDATDIPEDLIKIVAEKINDFEAYKRSKMLFFGLYNAYSMVITSEWRQALTEVLGKVGNNAFDVGDRKIMCSADTSGSMTCECSSKITCLDVSTLLTAAIAMSVPNAKAYATATSTKVVPIYGNDIMRNAKDIANVEVGWGTNFETLLEHYNGEDVVIIVSDGQQADNMERKWESLNKPKNAKLIVWNLVGYNNKISNRNDVIYLKGYSDSLLKTLANIIEGRAGQPEIVESISI